MLDSFAKCQEKARKPYVKPQVRKVELRIEEAVLGACKNTGFSGPGSSNCQTPVSCNILGS